MMRLLQINIQISVLIVGILLVRSFGKNHVSKRMIMILWNMVLIRALLPIQIPLEKFLVVEEKLNSFDLPAILSNQPLTQGLSEKAPAMGATGHTVSAFHVLLFLWIIGMTAILFFSIKNYRKEYKKLKNIRYMNNRQVRRMIRDAGLRRKISVYSSSEFCTPVTCGIFRPNIILPETFEKETETNIRNMIFHEITHIRKADVLQRYVMTFALCIHWFNPFFWIMYSVYFMDQEMACDESVLKRFSKEEAKTYAHTLIYMATQESQRMVVFSGFKLDGLRKKSKDYERIMASMEKQKMGVQGVLSFLVLVCFFAISFLSYTPTAEILTLPFPQENEKINMSFTSQKEVDESEEGNKRKEGERIVDAIRMQEMGIEVQHWDSPTAESEYYDVIIQDIEENYNDFSVPITDEQARALNYMTERMVADYCLERVKDGVEITSELHIKLLQKYYPNEW